MVPSPSGLAIFASVDRPGLSGTGQLGSGAVWSSASKPDECDMFSTCTLDYNKKQRGVLAVGLFMLI